MNRIVQLSPHHCCRKGSVMYWEVENNCIWYYLNKSKCNNFLHKLYDSILCYMWFDFNDGVTLCDNTCRKPLRTLFRSYDRSTSYLSTTQIVYDYSTQYMQWASTIQYIMLSCNMTCLVWKHPLPSVHAVCNTMLCNMFYDLSGL